MPHQEQIHADKFGVSNWKIRRGNAITSRYRDYTIDKLRVMAQKAEKLLLKIMNSDVVETVTFKTETETWLEFRDETETETSSKTPRPSLET